MAALYAPAGAMGADKDPLDWYTIEVVVFENLDPNEASEEYWPLDPGAPELEGAVELERTNPLLSDETGQASGPFAYAPLDRSELTLTDQFRGLKRSSRYRPILHVAWRQPGLPEEESSPVRLRSGAPLPARGPGAPPDDTEVFFGLPPRVPTVDGVLRVHRGRYLHVLADLRFYRPAQRAREEAPAQTTQGMRPLDAVMPGEEGFGETETVVEEQTPTLFRLQERRRVRSGELHYLDHPVFGMLVKIERYKLSARSRKDRVSAATR